MGDRNRNARLARLREAVLLENAIAGWVAADFWLHDVRARRRRAAGPSCQVR
jgi:hypothetical protein